MRRLFEVDDGEDGQDDDDLADKRPTLWDGAVGEEVEDGCVDQLRVRHGNGSSGLLTLHARGQEELHEEACDSDGCEKDPLLCGVWDLEREAGEDDDANEGRNDREECVNGDHEQWVGVEPDLADGAHGDSRSEGGAEGKGGADQPVVQAASGLVIEDGRVVFDVGEKGEQEVGLGDQHDATEGHHASDGLHLGESLSEEDVCHEGGDCGSQKGDGDCVGDVQVEEGPVLASDPDKPSDSTQQQKKPEALGSEREVFVFLVEDEVEDAEEISDEHADKEDLQRVDRGVEVLVDDEELAEHHHEAVEELRDERQEDAHVGHNCAVVELSRLV